MNLMEGFLKVFNKVNDMLLEKLEPEAGKESVDILEFTNYSALDIVLGKWQETRARNYWCQNQENRIT